MAGTPAIANIMCSVMPLAPFWVSNPQITIFRDLGCSAGASLLPSFGEVDLLGKVVAWCLEARSELWGRSSRQISEEKSRSQHFLGTVPWHSIVRRERTAWWIRISRPLSALPLLCCLSVTPNSFILQTHLVHSPIGMGMIIALFHSCWPLGVCVYRNSGQHSCLIPIGGFIRLSVK